MNLISSILISLVLTIIITIAIIFIYFISTGWKQFQFTTNQLPEWDAGSAGVERIRFMYCTFTIYRPDGTQMSKDVTGVLNGMAVAYDVKEKTANPKTLQLTGKLNPFSFVIKGYNDPSVVSDPSIPSWANSNVSLVGRWRVI